MKCNYFFSINNVVVARCNPGFWFKSMEVEVPMVCFKNWNFPDRTDSKCVPKCSTECQNGGFCIAPNICLCDEGYGGDFCEIKLCIQPPRYVNAVALIR